MCLALHILAAKNGTTATYKYRPLVFVRLVLVILTYACQLFQRSQPEVSWLLQQWCLARGQRPQTNAAALQQWQYKKNTQTTVRVIVVVVAIWPAHVAMAIARRVCSKLRRSNTYSYTRCRSCQLSRANHRSCVEVVFGSRSFRLRANRTAPNSAASISCAASVLLPLSRITLWHDCYH